MGDDNSPNTTLATRNLVTTLAVRPGLKYKAAFGDSGAEGVFTFNCQYFPRIVLDPASSTLDNNSFFFSINMPTIFNIHCFWLATEFLENRYFRQQVSIFFATNKKKWPLWSVTIQI
ncbi:MAG: hypothetical protein CMF52_00365 [Legionellales bacterium]|nr:hypothetical protein [Legionellales bacterium]